MREEKPISEIGRMSTLFGLSSIERDLYQRIEELERKVSLLGGDPKQLEMKRPRHPWLGGDSKQLEMDV